MENAMKRIIIVTLGAFVLGAGAATLLPSKTDRAFDQQEKNDPQTAMTYSYAPQLMMSRAGLRLIRLANYKKYAKDLPHLENITSASLSKTSDGGDWVITLTDVDGVTASIWLVGGKETGVFPVSTVTSY
jgi:hypothetical protein